MKNGIIKSQLFFFFFVEKVITKYHFQSLIIKALQNNVVKHIHTGTVVARFNRYSISKMFFQIPITFSNQIFCFFCKLMVLINNMIFGLIFSILHL